MRIQYRSSGDTKCSAEILARLVSDIRDDECKGSYVGISIKVEALVICSVCPPKTAGSETVTKVKIVRISLGNQF